MATATKDTTTFNLPCCPFCRDIDARLSVDLADVEAIRCSSCDAEFSPQAAHERVMLEAAYWAKVVRWAGTAKGMLGED